MAVPKRKMSRANTRARRAAWRTSAAPPDLVRVTVDGEQRLVPRKYADAYRRFGGEAR